jgi:hypothetical protein
VRDRSRNAKVARKEHLRNVRISRAMKRAWAKRKRTSMDHEPYEEGQPRDDSPSTAGLSAYRERDVLPPQLRVNQEELPAEMTADLGGQANLTGIKKRPTTSSSWRLSSS